MARFIIFSVALAALAAVSACSAGHSAENPASLSRQMTADRKISRMNDSIMFTAGQQMLDQAYRVGAEDLLEIDAYNVEELKKTVRVNSEGNIGLPLVGVLNVKGLTTFEIERLIAKKLEKYVEETVVTVLVKEYKSQRISVVGAVNKPQVFAVTGQMYLLDMLMMSEGLSKEAGTICYVIRQTAASADTKASTIVIDLEELLDSGNMSLNIPVFAGDVVNVPKGGVIFVDGSVKTPGAYTVRAKNTTLVQAIAMAQGALPDAALTDVRIFRDNGKGERDIITADYEAISRGEKGDVILADNDIIIVPQSGAKNFFNGFVSTLKGFISFGLRPL